MERLLGGFPTDLLAILTGSHYLKVVPGNASRKAKNNYVIAPLFAAKGRWGLGRLLSLLNWLALPFIGLFALCMIQRKSVRVILSVAHGQFFVAAGLVARLSGIPLVLWVHDDWVAGARKNSYLLKYFASGLFSFAVKSARHIYAISEPMADWLRLAYGVRAEIQLPCSEEIAIVENGSHGKDVFRMAFAGTNVATGGTVGILADVLTTGGRLPDGRRIELHLYMPAAGIRPEWRHQNIVVHPWLSQTELQKELGQADLLFLPYNFENHSYLWARSFPSKAADYLRYRKPVLVMAPQSAAIVAYARAHGFADVIDRPDPDALLCAIRRIASDASYREELSAKAWDTFKRNHDAAQQRNALDVLLDRLAPDRSSILARYPVSNRSAQNTSER